MVIAIMAAHHRLTWIHPFLDGNGRVGRLHTDLLLKAIGVGAYGIWCISRGLARANDAYQRALARADQPRQGAVDGHGALSERALMEFCEFMLRTSIGQVEYMSGILNPWGMGRRMQAYIDDRNKGLVIGVQKIKPEAIRLLEKAFMYGEFSRSEMDAISGLGSSVTRKLVQQMKKEGLLSESSSRSPLRWSIPEHAERYYFSRSDANLEPPTKGEFLSASTSVRKDVAQELRPLFEPQYQRYLLLLRHGDYSSGSVSRRGSFRSAGPKPILLSCLAREGGEVHLHLLPRRSLKTHHRVVFHLFELGDIAVKTGESTAVAWKRSNKHLLTQVERVYPIASDVLPTMLITLEAFSSKQL